MADKRSEYFNTSSYFKQLKMMRDRTYRIGGIPEPLSQKQFADLSHKSKEYIQNLIIETKTAIVFLEEVMSNLDNQSTQWNIYNVRVEKFERQEKELKKIIGKNSAKRQLRDELKHEMEVLKKYGDPKGKDADVMKFLKNEMKTVSKNVRGQDWSSVMEALKDRWSPARSKTWKRMKMAGKFIGNSDFRKFAVKRKASTVAKNMLGKMFLGGQRFDPEEDVLTEYQKYASMKANEASQVESIRTKNKSYFTVGDSRFSEIEDGKRKPVKDRSKSEARSEKARNQLKQMQVENVKANKEMLLESDAKLASDLGKQIGKKNGGMSSLLKWLAGGALVAGGIAIGKYVYDKWDTISDYISGIYNKIKGWWNDVKRGINKVLKVIPFVDFQLDVDEPYTPLTGATRDMVEYYSGTNNVSRDPGMSRMYDLSGSDLGQLSHKYESRGGVGTVSSGEGDKGGISFGKYQFASKNEGLSTFMQHLKENNPEMYEKLMADGADIGGNGKNANKQFIDNWKKLSAEDAQGFGKAQDEAAKAKWYNPTANKFANITGFDPSTRGPAVQSALWSMGIQHGGVDKIISAAGLTQDMTDEEIIDRLYDARTAYVQRVMEPGKVKDGVLNRYVAERMDAQEMNRQHQIALNNKKTEEKSEAKTDTKEESGGFWNGIASMFKRDKVEVSDVLDVKDGKIQDANYSEPIQVVSNPSSSVLNTVNAQSVPSSSSSGSKNKSVAYANNSSSQKRDTQNIPIVLTGGGGMWNVLGINS